MTRKFLALILAVIATVTLAVATTSSSSSPTQGAGKVSMQDFSYLTITGEAIRSLPDGENTIYISSASGGVWKTTNGGQSWNLTKTGKGTFILPNTYRGTTTIQDGAQNSANSSSAAPKSTGVTKVGAGTLEHSGGTSGLMKRGTGRLVLSSASGVVYEFRNLRSEEFDRIFMPGGESLKTYVEHHRPADAMAGWPFQRLLIGSGDGIAQASGWWKTKPTVAISRIRCTAGFCSCSGSDECYRLTTSGQCSSDLTCDGSGNNVKCYCSSR